MRTVDHAVYFSSPGPARRPLGPCTRLMYTVQGVQVKKRHLIFSLRYWQIIKKILVWLWVYTFSKLVRIKWVNSIHQNNVRILPCDYVIISSVWKLSELSWTPMQLSCQQYQTYAGSVNYSDWHGPSIFRPGRPGLFRWLYIRRTSITIFQSQELQTWQL